MPIIPMIPRIMPAAYHPPVPPPMAPMARLIPVPNTRVDATPMLSVTAMGTPLAFLSVTNGNVKVLPAQSNTTLDRAIELMPEAITTLEQAISGLCKKGAEEAK